MTQSKPHLAIYPDPIVRNGSDVETLCGELLKCVQIAGFSDVAIMGQSWKSVMNSLSTCADCFRIAETLSSERPQDVQFVYAIVPRDSRLGQRVAALEESA